MEIRIRTQWELDGIKSIIRSLIFLFFFLNLYTYLSSLGCLLPTKIAFLFYRNDKVRLQEKINMGQVENVKQT